MKKKITTPEAIRLIKSDYKDLPPALKHLEKKVQPGVDKRQMVKNAFLLGYGETVILELYDASRERSVKC